MQCRCTTIQVHLISCAVHCEKYFTICKRLFTQLKYISSVVAEMQKFSDYISSVVGQMYTFFQLQQGCPLFEITSLQSWQRCRYFESTTIRCDSHNYWVVIQITSELLCLSQLIDVEEMQLSTSGSRTPLADVNYISRVVVEMYWRCKRLQCIHVLLRTE